MRQISFNVLAQRNKFRLAALPLVLEFGHIHISDNMNQMQVGIFPKVNQRWPVFVLVILNSDPSVVVTVGGVIGERTRIFAVLQMDDPVGIVRCRIDQMT